jgi:hypothetical protein
LNANDSEIYPAAENRWAWEVFLRRSTFYARWTPFQLLLSNSQGEKPESESGEELPQSKK